MKRLLILNLILLVIVSAVISSSQLVYSATSTDAVDVTAVVPTVAPPGGGGPVGDLQVSNVVYNAGCTSVAINWQATLVDSTDSISSEVTYWPQSNPGNTITVNASNGANPSVTISGLSMLTTYQFTVLSEAGSLDDESGPFTFTTSCTVTSPTIDVRPANQGTVVDITYPNIPDIAGFKIYAGQTTCPAASTPIQQSNVAKAANSQETIILQSNTTLGQTYGYTVCIFNTSGIYAAPAYDTAQRVASTPTNITAVPAAGEINLSWSNPANNSALDFTFANTRIIRASSCGASGVVIYQGTGSSYTDSGLNNNQTYAYQISARNSYGEYSAVTCILATPSLVPAGQCLTNIDATSLPDSIALSWSNPVDAPGFDFNQAQWRRGSSCSSNISAGSSAYSGSGESFGDGSVVPDQLYFYSAFARYNSNQANYCGCLAATALVEIEEPIELCTDCTVIPSDPALIPEFFANDGLIELLPQNQTIVSVVDNQILISIDRDLLDKPVDLIAIQYQGRTYILSFDSATNSYRALFTAGAEAGRDDLYVSIIYDDQTMSTQLWTLELVDPGLVIDQETGESIAGALVSLWQNGQRVTGYGITNPFETGSDGSYYFIVPNGRYTLIVDADGYQTRTIAVNVSNQVIVQKILLKKELSIIEAINDLIFDNQAVEKASLNIIEPLNLALALLNLALMAPLWTSLYYLQSLFTEPFLWLTRQKRKGWGVVYNAITKQPVDLAIVRLYNADTKQLVKSRVTDAAGRYSFLVDEGRYYVEASKGGFSFPSSILQNKTEDYHYTDVYHGKEIVIKDGQKGIISANIPLDPDNITATNQQIIHQYNFKKVQRITSLIGPIVSLIVFAIVPGILMGIMVVVHIVIYALFRRLSVSPVPKSWGVIYDQATRQPIGKAITRIFAPEYGRMLEAYVTDRYGRYGFLVANNIYYVTADKAGYSQAKTSDIDLKQSSAEEIVDQDINLNQSQSQPPADVSNSDSHTVDAKPTVTRQIPTENNFG